MNLERQKFEFFLGANVYLRMTLERREEFSNRRRSNVHLKMTLQRRIFLRTPIWSVLFLPFLYLLAIFRWNRIFNKGPMDES